MDRGESGDKEYRPGQAVMDMRIEDSAEKSRLERVSESKKEQRTFWTQMREWSDKRRGGKVNRKRILRSIQLVLLVTAYQMPFQLAYSRLQIL